MQAMRWREAGAAIAALFVVSRGILVLLALFLENDIPLGYVGPAFDDRLGLRSLTGTDSVYLLGIAAEGYHAEPVSQAFRDWVFFPLYPLVTRAASLLTLGDVAIAGVVVANLAFIDVAVKREETEKPVVAVAETFDNLTYRVTLARKKNGEAYYLTFDVAGEPPKKRVAEKDEKPEERERRDKDYAESLKRLEERVAAEKALTKWTYVVEKSAVDALLKDRADMTARKEKK